MENQELEQLKQEFAQLKSQSSTQKKPPYKAILFVTIGAVVIAVLIPILIILYSSAVPETYTVTFRSMTESSEGQTLEFIDKVKDGKLATPPEVGHTFILNGKIWKFDGWYIDSTRWTQNTPITQDTVIYGKWYSLTI